MQKIKYGENLLDIKNDSDASETYSAILPLGSKIKEESETESETGSETIEKRLTVEALEDGDITDDIVKSGDIIYSRSAVENYGFILTPISQSTWDDVTEAINLKTKAVEYLTGTAVKLKNTVEIKAVDLNFSNEEIEAFRIYRYVEVDSAPHNHQERYKLTKLEIDLMNPQNTQIQLGETRYSLHDSNYNKFQNANEKIQSTKNELKEYVSKKVEEVSGIEELEEIKTTIVEQTTELTNTCNEIILSAMSSYVEINNGVTVREIKKFYKASSSDTALIGESEWSESIPQLTEINFALWCYEEITHSDNRVTNTEPYLILIHNGIGIQSITEYYAVNSDKEKPVIKTVVTNEDGTESTVEYDLEWLENELPAMSINNMYLWNYNVVNYTDSTTSETSKRFISEYVYSYSELTDIVKSQLQILSESISINISNLTEQVALENDGLRNELNEIKQNFMFNINGLTIGQSNSPCKVIIDEDSIELSLNDVPLLWMNVVTGETHTEKLTVTEELNLFEYKLSKDNSGNVNLEYIG